MRNRQRLSGLEAAENGDEVAVVLLVGHHLAAFENDRPIRPLLSGSAVRKFLSAARLKSASRAGLTRPARQTKISNPTHSTFRAEQQ